MAADISVDSLGSIAGAKPISGVISQISRAACRTLASNIGPGWQQEDFLLNNATIMLFMIEYASLNSQEIIGMGVCSITDDKSSNMAVNTGGTSSLGNATGMASGTNGKVSISYRGKEDAFGNIWSFVDGANIDISNGNVVYADHGFADNVDTDPYRHVGFTFTRTNGYVSAFGWSEDCDFLFLPAETLGFHNKPIGDYIETSPSTYGWFVSIFGGNWDITSYAGICCWRFTSASTTYSRTVGARLVYIPD